MSCTISYILICLADDGRGIGRSLTVTKIRILGRAVIRILIRRRKKNIFNEI